MIEAKHALKVADGFLAAVPDTVLQGCKDHRIILVLAVFVGEDAEAAAFVAGQVGN